MNKTSIGSLIVYVFAFFVLVTLFAIEEESGFLGALTGVTLIALYFSIKTRFEIALEKKGGINELF